MYSSSCTKCYSFIQTTDKYFYTGFSEGNSVIGPDKLFRTSEKQIWYFVWGVVFGAIADSSSDSSMN